MVLIKQLLLILVLILFNEVSDPVRVTLHSHVFGEIPKVVVLNYLHSVRDISPGNHGILGYVRVAPPCYLVQPLQVLVVRHVFIDPSVRLLSVQVVAEGLLLHVDAVTDHR
jgi:hypothetical protein